jgi:dienelactone hydrolase
MMKTACTVLIAVVGLSFQVRAENARLPGTTPLKWTEEELPDRLMDGAHQFVERKMVDAAKNRQRFWPAMDAGAEAWKKPIEENREELRTIIGAVDERLPPHIEYFGNTFERVIAYEGDGFRVTQVRWPVLKGVWGEGLLVSPEKTAIAAAIVIPDADQTPEQLLGMVEGVPADSQIVRQLIANNVAVLIPTLVSRQKLETDDARLKRSDQTQREWLYRQAFHMGRHIIGYEVQKVLAAVDWLEVRHRQEQALQTRPRGSDRIPDQADTKPIKVSSDLRLSNLSYAVGRGTEVQEPIGVAGYGEGALIAFYAAAIDTRIDVTLVSGYFDSREDVWSQPIYRNVWSLLNRFSDIEIAALILPRKLIIEYSESPTIVDHKGDSKTPTFERVRGEVARMQMRVDGTRPDFVHGKNGSTVGPFSATASNAFLKALRVAAPAKPVPRMHDNRFAFDPDARQRRTVQQIEDHVQGLVRKSEHVRDKFMLYKLMPELADSRWSTEKKHPTHDVKNFIEGAKEFRRRFNEEGIGRFDQALLPFNARSRQVAETDKWIAYDIVLDVFDDLIAWGVLVVPKDMKPGEKRPVVVCQHGRNGVPRDTVDNNKTAYNDFAAKLAERGFITFAPHNLYRGEDRYRWLDRKANTIGCSLFSFIVAQHDQILRWLDSQPFVDGDRIAFYGLSYGGETAVRVPTILEKYCLSICSGDFNQWTRKIAATDQPFSFIRSIEWEMPYWNLGHTFDYAEMTYLMVPRPFMVERGHHDRVGRDRWVAHEFAKVRWLYAQFGLVDKVGIEYFQGGHSINGEASFRFLHKHLNWPEP